MSDKHDNFRRLSEKRMETVEDAIRIWSNLSGPSYEFTISEVMGAIDRISTAAIAAQLRFNESKCWRDQQDASHVPQEATQEPVQDDEPLTSTDAVRMWEIEQQMPSTAPADTITPRQREMLRIWDEVESDEGALLEVLAMQREVIASLQSTIDNARSKASA